MSQSIYERIGGEAAVKAAVDLFYRKVMEDERLQGWFDNMDMEQQMAKMRAFMTMAFGGPSNYNGRDMAAAHAALVRRGLNDVHFDCVATQLAATLRELNVPSDLAGEVLSLVESTRDDVLGRGVLKRA